MATSKLVQWQGGSRTSVSGSSKFLLKQSREPYGSIPKTNYAFTLWLVENDFGSINFNDPTATADYIRLREQFFGACGGGNGTLLFGVQVVRKDRVALERQTDVRVRATWGYPRFKETREVLETIFVEVNNEDTVTISDYFITQDSPETIRIPSIFVGSSRYKSTVQWTEGGAYNSDGDRLTRIYQLNYSERTIDASGTMTLKYPQKLVGTLKITIKHQFDDYVLTVPPQDLGTSQDIFDEQKVYKSNVLGFGGGDYVNMSLEIPEDAADCIPYAQILDPETGRYVTVINGSDTHNTYDSDGDGFVDGGVDPTDGGTDANGNPISAECVCWMCGGTGILPEPDCIPSELVDCTCPNCSGTGILPACQGDEDDEYNRYYYTYNNYGGDDSGEDDTDKPYTLEVDKHLCTNQVTDWNIKKN